MSTTNLQQYNCDVCSISISRTVRINCADSVCTDWDACVACFAKGATREGSNHKPWHAYRVIAPIERPLFDPDWSGDEELSLLSGSEKFGLGNWSDVAEHVGNRRTKEECERHYIRVYIRSDAYPLPDLNATVEYDPEIFQARKRRRIDERAALSKLPPPLKQKPITSTPSCHEVQGYMPGRLEFETEHENEAEISVKDLEFEQDLADGTDDEVQLKLTVLDIYNSRLTRRAERKRVIFEHGMLEYKRNQALEKKKSKEERDLINKTKPFARLQSTKDYETFVEGLLHELSLRKRIAELQEWRKNGLTTMDQGLRYERDKQQRLLMRSNGITTDRFVARYAKTTDEKPRKNTGPTASSTDVQLLSRGEQALCSTLKMLPKAYLVVKETIAREFCRTGGSLKRKEARQLLKIDGNKTAKVFEYLTGNFRGLTGPPPSLPSQTSQQSQQQQSQSQPSHIIHEESG